MTSIACPVFSIADGSAALSEEPCVVVVERGKIVCIGTEKTCLPDGGGEGVMSAMMVGMGCRAGWRDNLTWVRVVRVPAGDGGDRCGAVDGRWANV